MPTIHVLRHELHLAFETIADSGFFSGGRYTKQF